MRVQRAVVSSTNTTTQNSKNVESIQQEKRDLGGWEMQGYPFPKTQRHAEARTGRRNYIKQCAGEVPTSPSKDTILQKGLRSHYRNSRRDK